MQENNQIAKLEHVKVLDIINNSAHLSPEDKIELSKKLISDDIEIRKGAYEKIAQSQIAFNDLNNVQERLSNIKKDGMYAISKQEIKTGSGKVEIEMRGGDSKIIIPVISIIALVVIVIFLIVFWG